MVEVFDWQADGASFGCGTRVEFEYWSSLGVIPEGASLATVIAHEPASKDEARKAAWGIA